MWQLWLVIAGICLLIEAITASFLLFWFAIGAVITMIVSFFIEDIFILSTIFLVSSTILVLCTRKLLNKFLKTKDIPTNVYSVIGKHGIVTLEINSSKGTGQIKIDGEFWSAKCESGTVIPKGTEVEIQTIDGVRAFVKPI